MNMNLKRNSTVIIDIKINKGKEGHKRKPRQA